MKQNREKLEQAEYEQKVALERAAKAKELKLRNRHKVRYKIYFQTVVVMFAFLLYPVLSILFCPACMKNLLLYYYTAFLSIGHYILSDDTKSYDMKKIIFVAI